MIGLFIKKIVKILELKGEKDQLGYLQVFGGGGGGGDGDGEMGGSVN